MNDEIEGSCGGGEEITKTIQMKEKLNFIFFSFLNIPTEKWFS